VDLVSDHFLANRDVDNMSYKHTISIMVVSQIISPEVLVLLYSRIHEYKLVTEINFLVLLMVH